MQKLHTSEKRSLKCIAEKSAFKCKKCRPVVRRTEPLPTADKGIKRERISYQELPTK